MEDNNDYKGDEYEGKWWLTALFFIFCFLIGYFVIG